MHDDLDNKQEYILDLLKAKEVLEKQLASFGNIHHIYVSFSVKFIIVENFQ